MNRLLIICSVAALIFGESVLANTSEQDKDSEIAKLQKAAENQDVRKFGTKDQWQHFFESQGEPQQLFFLSRKEADAIRKRKREKMDFLIKQLESLKTEDDVSTLTNKLKKLKIENENATGKLIDVDDESMEDSSDDYEKIRESDSDRQTIQSQDSGREEAKAKREAEVSEKVRQSQQHYRVRLNKQQYRENSAVRP